LFCFCLVFDVNTCFCAFAADLGDAYSDSGDDDRDADSGRKGSAADLGDA
jgi:hypothetical protein